MMATFELVRVVCRKDVTFGVLLMRDNPICVTLELPWRNNERLFSCIPDGTYKLGRHYSSRFGWCIKLYDVSGRSDILIHPGNTVSDTEGCILVGSSFGDEASIMSSRVAFNRLMQVFPPAGTYFINVVSKGV